MPSETYKPLRPELTTRAGSRPDLLKAGFPTLRITHPRLKHHPTNEAQRLRQILKL